MAQRASSPRNHPRSHPPTYNTLFTLFQSGPPASSRERGDFSRNLEKFEFPFERDYFLELGTFTLGASHSLTLLAESTRENYVENSWKFRRKISPGICRSSDFLWLPRQKEILIRAVWRTVSIVLNGLFSQRRVARVTSSGRCFARDLQTRRNACTRQNETTKDIRLQSFPRAAYTHHVHATAVSASSNLANFLTGISPRHAGAAIFSLILLSFFFFFFFFFF